ncbi:DNA repair protein [Hafnia paralvei]|uniref:phospholipase D family protein n=1 Tax=Hafnia paralvei TaxID=546367 RepID=UPI000DF1CDC1|nr:phospholipase D family protein [Hafnia paralvei]RDA72705.1 DNA repair protein [Hafnia paralvei]RDA73214.1 DNA repair protein [Hafnia paralvei]RDA73468.1 DNA repair protein [Hafnia paralvei]RDA81873.1 DNA repair protein [Hafnia paralvei]RDA82154.1 DNA repair protein [Hafnia paralvei]
MIEILNTTGINYHLERIIAKSETRLIIISPYLKLSARIKELIEDKDRLKVDVRIIYGKSELNPKDHNWLISLPYVRLSFCQNLHAKLYANEKTCLICSLNLYDFSQIHNHELGVLIEKDNDPVPYENTISEAQRLIRISTENIPELQKVKLSKVVTESDDNQLSLVPDTVKDKVTSTVLAKNLSIPLHDLYNRLILKGYLIYNNDNKLELTLMGIEAGGVCSPNRYKKNSVYFLWPSNISID